MAKKKNNKKEDWDSSESPKKDSQDTKKDSSTFKAVEKKEPLQVFSFPNLDDSGMNVSVKARSYEEALKKAREVVKK